MNIESIRRAARLVGLVLPLAWLPASAAAQVQAYGVAVNAAGVNQTTPVAVLPAGEDMAQEQGQSVDVPGLVSASDAFAIASGDASDASSSVSSATLGAVSLLNGLISADGVVAMATSTVGAGSDAAGSSIANLVVNGVSVSDPAPNTRMSLPDVGYVVLNEQQQVGATGLTVNMIHVVLQQPILGLLGQVIGYRTVGNIVVGSATSAAGS